MSGEKIVESEKRPKMTNPEAKLIQYEALLKKWQKSVNLVSDSSLRELKKRHFEDSLQIIDQIPEGARIFDLGSGAGFPGMVLAMMRPDAEVTLIESDHKKCTFLSTVSRETMTPVNIVNQRIEDVSRETIPDIITARALASLDKLFAYCCPWAEKNPELVMLFLKGEKAEQEIAKAREGFDFEIESIKSRTAAGGVILKIKNLSYISNT